MKNIHTIRCEVSPVYGCRATIIAAILVLLISAALFVGALYAIKLVFGL